MNTFDLICMILVIFQHKVATISLSGGGGGGGVVGGSQ